MQQVHFYSGQCQLGIVFPPHGQTELNRGVESAPSAILSKEFLSNFPYATQNVYRFPEVDEIDKSKYYETLATHLGAFGDLIKDTFQSGEIQIVVGGDHSVSFSSLLALFSRFNPADVGYIQFDAHGDIHMYATSPSKNFHGMYVRPFVETFDLPVIANLVTTFLPMENIMYIGNMDLEPAEKELFISNSIREVNQQELRQAKFMAELPKFINRFKHLHINFDIDVMDHSLVTATGIPAQNGLLWEEVQPILTLLKSHPSWSLDLVEINPEKLGAEQTVKVAQQILETLLGS